MSIEILSIAFHETSHSPSICDHIDATMYTLIEKIGKSVTNYHQMVYHERHNLKKNALICHFNSLTAQN